MARVSAFQADCCGFESHRLLHYFGESRFRAYSSVGQSAALIMLRSLVQIQVRPPFKCSCRRLAQLASARALGARGCEFESRVSDHISFIIFPRSLNLWRYRLVVRTTGFHPVNRSSILRSATIIQLKEKNPFVRVDFLMTKIYFKA